jgi:very-short-patch-repair endonuclease
VPAKLKIEDVRARGLTRGFVLLSADYQNSKAPLLWRCSSQHDFSSRFNDIWTGYGCPYCSCTVKVSVADCRKLADTRSGRLISDKIINSQTSVTWECKSGHLFDMRPTHVSNGSWCWKCDAYSRRLPWSEYRNLASSQKGTVQINENDTPDSRTPITWTCSEGHSFSKSLSRAKRYWCSTCSRLVRRSNTKAQSEVFELCKIMYSDAQLNASGVLKSSLLELDVWIPSLRKAVELDGERWHAAEDAKERDARKDSECKESGIQLLRIGYKKHWFRKKRPIGEALIKDFLKEDNLPIETKSLTTE